MYTVLMEHICTVADCHNQARNGTSPYCEKHYSRWKRHGDVTMVLKDHTPAVERWKTSYKVDSETGCWVWTNRGATQDGGYGLISNGAANQSIPAHKFVYEQVVGPVPKGMELDHLCLNKLCVNPEHLEPVTNIVNQVRAAKNPTPGDDATRRRIREYMREYRAALYADPHKCNYCGAALTGTFFKLCEGCRQKKHEAYLRRKGRA